MTVAHKLRQNRSPVKKQDRAVETKPANSDCRTWSPRWHRSWTDHTQIGNSTLCSCPR